MTGRAAGAFVVELLEALPADARPMAQSVLARYEGERIYIPAAPAARRRRLARAMLRHGMSRMAIQETLRAQFGISADAARRDMRRVLEEL